MGSLKPGNYILTPDGRRAQVKAIFPQGIKQVFEVEFSGGTTVECTADHLWQMSYKGGGLKDGQGKKHKRIMTKVMSLAEFKDRLYWKKNYRFWIPQTQPVDFNRRPISVPAYTLGVLLGDGHLRKGGISFTTADREIADRVQMELGLFYEVKESITKSAAYQYSIQAHGFSAQYSKHADGNSGRGIWRDMRTLNLTGTHSWDKFIPDEYKYNSVGVRFDVIRGLMDTDGSVEKNGKAISYSSVSERLARGVAEVIESLGGIVHITSRVTFYTHNGERKQGRRSWRLTIRFENPGELFNLTRKRKQTHPRRLSQVKRKVISVKPVGEKECQCISIDSPDGLYLTDHFVVTHNTRAGCYKIAHKASIQGNLCVICRKTLTSLRETTLRVLLEPEGDLPPVLPKGSYVHHKSHHRIKLHNGGEIIYFGFDRWGGVLGLTAGSIFVDEVIEITEEQYIWLLSRLTHRADPCRQLFGATNPGSPSHFLYRRFYKEQASDRELIHTTAAENIFLPQDYLDYLDTLSGLYYDRYVLGKWVAFEGMIYDNWNRDIHLIHRDVLWKWLLITVDEGYENPCSAGLHGVDGDNRLHRLKTFYKRHVLQSDLVQILTRFGTEVRDAHGKELERRFVVDPSAAGLIAAMEDAGLTVESADNAVIDGIQETRNRLAQNGDELPRYTVEPGGEGNDKVVEEIESYHYDKDEKPAKSFDHSMDEMRYGCMYMRQYAPPELFSLAFESTEKPEETHCRKREIDGSTGQERDSLRELAIMQGYVSETCILDGALVMALVCQRKRPCDGCSHAEWCEKMKQLTEQRRDAILTREGAWS